MDKTTNTKQSHTPGPWNTLKARTLINIKGPKGEQICQIPLRDEANARLIAAAPELLEACKFMAQYIRDNVTDFPDEIIDAEQAINKAEGSIPC